MTTTQHIRRLLSPSFALSVVALLVAMSATSYAAYTVGANSVGTTQLKNGAVTAPKLSADRRAAQPTLLPGQAMVGHFSASGGHPDLGLIVADVTFPAALPSSFNRSHVQFLDVGQTTARCPGRTKAAAGWACFYLDSFIGEDTVPDYWRPELGDGAATPNIGRVGARVYWFIGAAGPQYVAGTWTVRAP